MGSLLLWAERVRMATEGEDYWDRNPDDLLVEAEEDDARGRWFDARLKRETVERLQRLDDRA